MSYKILVTAPVHNAGVSVVSLVLNHLMTLTGYTSTLMFTEGGCPIPRYLGLQSSGNDPTRSIMQIVHLLENGAIKDSDILDYTIPYLENGYLLHTADPVLTAQQASNVVRDVFMHVDTNVVVCDDSSASIDLQGEIFENADLVFVVINPCRKHYVSMNEFLQMFPSDVKKRVIVMMNNYTEVVGAARDIAKHLKVKSSVFCKLHYNPYITDACLKGRCKDIIPLSLEKDPRFANLFGDLRELTSCVTNSMLVDRR